MRIGGTHIALFIAVVMITLLNASCKKVNTLTSGGTLTFSTDTLKFDTLFTAAGSYTNGLLIYNPQSEAVVVSSIKLQNGAASYFHLNVDGFAGNTAANIKIAPHDSIYVFATVDIDSTNNLMPFLITDALIATMNGKDYTVPFTAYGQNAHYIISDSFATGTYNWLIDKPYVVIHNCVIGQGAILNMPLGCRVYMHQDAQFIVYPGAALNIGTGAIPSTGADSVVFQGDRLDRAYFGYVGYPGEWCGLWYTPLSTGNISHAVFKNCGGGNAYYQYTIIPAALRADSGATVNLDHTIIENSISLGILNFGGTVNATDCNVNTTGGQALAVSQGGFGSLVNCTFANYGTAQLSHAQAGTVAILDWYTPDGTNYYYGNLNVVMRNCIVYGSLDSEIVCDTSGSPAGTQARLLMDHCLLKMGNVREPFIQFDSCIFNQDPMFKNSANGDFSLMTGSPAIKNGNPNGAPLNNIIGVGWSPPDIGCY